MIRSMTGFAGAERQGEFGRLAWELRSVNHRYLEIGLRLPEDFRALEPAIRECVGRHVSRGKVDVALKFQPAGARAAARLELNSELAQRLVALRGELGGLVQSDPGPDLDALFAWPGVVEERSEDPEPLRRAAVELLEEAAAGLREARTREGAQLAAVIRERLDGIARWTAEVRQWLPEIRDGLRQRLLDRIEDLPTSLEPGRIEQEVAMQAQKIDVDEELDRLDAHVTEARHILERDEPVGRRLDFLMQEFNREANTLASKSQDVETTRSAVEIKVLVEQMREQVQNVE